jgi:hypothetical protein
MGEPAKALPLKLSEKPRVLSVYFQEGGVDLYPFGAQKSMQVKRPEGRAKGVGFEAPVEMELDRQLGGVTIRYVTEGKPRFYLVPLAHCRQVELAE